MRRRAVEGLTVRDSDTSPLKTQQILHYHTEINIKSIQAYSCYITNILLHGAVAFLHG